jgi:superfamily II RNA helicase
MDPNRAEIPPHKLVSALRGYNLLPAIIFMPTRRKCDEAASEVALDKTQRSDPEKLAQRKAIFEEFAAANPEILKHKHQKILVNSGIGSHHAGHIPPWKLLIEKMMSAGLLNAIFATSTVAAGVDFPARTAVIVNADTRGNEGWRPLRASELQQMTGRAGRRGKDKVGFVVLAPGQFQNPKKIAELLKAQPDPLESRFRATYTSLLNLLDAFGNFDQIREIAEKSFAFRKTSKTIGGLEQRRRHETAKIEKLLAGTDHSIEDARGFERLISARNRLHEAVPVTRAEMRDKWLRENVVPGRIVSQGRSGKRLYMVINSHNGKVSAMRDDGGGTSFEIARVSRIYNDIYALKAPSIEQAFFDVFENKNLPLVEPKFSRESQGTDKASAVFDELIEKFGSSQSELWETLPSAENLERISRDMAFLKDEIWQPFEDRAKVLDHFGYIDFSAQKATESGKWLADLRVDRPLLIGEALRSGIFNDMTPKLAAGFMAALTADADRNYGEMHLSDKLLETIEFFDQTIHDVAQVERKYHIDAAEEVNFSAASAAERWAGGMAWDDLVKRSGAEEGDLFRLLSRTGEALMQIAHQKGDNTAAAQIARQAAESILREPVR